MKTVKTKRIDTPLGVMLASGDQETLYFLEFETDREIAILPGFTKPIHSIEKELHLYFKGKLTTFTTPLGFVGTPFQKWVWEELQKIPYGETRSYAEIAAAIGKPTAYRAVANANGANRFALIVPCHRVIQSNGKLGGYGGTPARKQWLLDHELRHKP